MLLKAFLAFQLLLAGFLLPLLDVVLCLGLLESRLSFLFALLVEGVAEPYEFDDVSVHLHFHAVEVFEAISELHSLLNEEELLIHHVTFGVALDFLSSIVFAVAKSLRYEHPDSVGVPEVLKLPSRFISCQHSVSEVSPSLETPHVSLNNKRSIGFSSLYLSLFKNNEQLLRAESVNFVLGAPNAVLVKEVRGHFTL